MRSAVCSRVVFASHLISCSASSFQRSCDARGQLNERHHCTTFARVERAHACITITTCMARARCPPLLQMKMMTMMTTMMTGAVLLLLVSAAAASSVSLAESITAKNGWWSQKDDALTTGEAAHPLALPILQMAVSPSRRYPKAGT